MGRSPCCDDIGLKKGPWTPEEDEKLTDFIKEHGHGSWRSLPKRAGLNRCGKSCRLRWTNYLRPDIKRGQFSDEEEQIIIQLHSALGNKWSRIAAHLPGRTDNEIKNYWNTHMRRKLLQRGIDPKTHKPISDFNLLANLSQLLSASPNFANLMNSSHHNSFEPRLDVTHQQTAQIQFLQSIMQVINATPFPNIPEFSLLGPPNYNNNIYQNLPSVTSNPPQTPFGFPNLGETNIPQIFDNFPSLPNSIPPFESGFQPEILTVDYKSSPSSNFHTQMEISLPALVSSSLEGSNTSIGNHMESKINPTSTCPSIDSPTFTSFEDWEKLLDDEANGTWKDILG